MARGGCFRWGCCLAPIIVLVLIVGSIVGAYLWLPIGNTFQIADKELLPGYTMNSLGIADKSVRDILHTPIGELGSVGDLELEGLRLAEDLGLKTVTIWDLTKKEIKDLGDLGNVDIFDLMGGIAGSFSGGNPKFADGGTDIPIEGFPTTPEEFLGMLSGLTLNAAGLGSEKLVELSISSLIGIFTEGKDPMSMFPLLNKKIGELGNGNFKKLNLLDFFHPPEEFSDIDFSSITALTLENLTFTDSSLNILNMSILDFANHADEISFDFDELLGDVVSNILIPQEEIESVVIEDDFKEGVFDQTEELDKAQDALKNNSEAGAGIPIKDDGSGEVDYLEIFKNPVEFDNRALITLKDTELTAIFNEILSGGGDEYQELKDLNATIRQIYLPGRNAGGIITVKTTLTIKTASLKTAGYDLGPMEKALPEVLYLSVISVIYADETGEVMYDNTLAEVRLENLPESLSKTLLATVYEGESFGSYAGKLVSELFCTFVNNLGDAGMSDGDGGFILGEGGIEQERYVYIVTRTAAGDIEELPEAA